ncbi:MAG: serine/threonine protein kinase [Myxococcales bacterium]|nr:serine/threonine protein kinase [Myxococcales bacterium]
MATGRSTGGKAIGPAIKGYRLTGRLGAGAMGEVYEGVHQLIGKRVAVKVLKSAAQDDLNGAQRLLEEARAVNAISHPGIVDIFDAGTLPDGRPYLVMERLEGHSLLEHLKGHRQLAVREVLHLLAGILEPLDAAHRAGVIHRDLKPSNVFLCDTTVGLPRVKLVDFGIARRAGREEALTQPLMTLGSLGFMGPEHLAGEVEPASDLYSVGCLAFQMVTGSPVFTVKGGAQLAQAHLAQPAPPLRSRRPDVPIELEAWVAWLLEKQPSARPSTAEVALAVLKEAELASAGVGTTPGGPRFGELARAFDRKARAMKAQPALVEKPQAPAVPPRKAATPGRVPEGKRPTQPGAGKIAAAKSTQGTDLMPAFSPMKDGSSKPTAVTAVKPRVDAATLFDEDEEFPPGDRPTVINWKRPDKP